VLPGRGDGTFAPPIDRTDVHPYTLSVGVNGFPTDLEVVDLDRDGTEDLIIAVRDRDEVQLWRGLGGGHFAPLPALTGLRRPLYLDTFDLDGDGHLEVGISHALDDVVSLLSVTPDPNGEGITAVVKQAVPLDRQPANVVLTELQPGRPALITVHKGAGTIAVHQLGVSAAASVIREGSHLADADLPPCRPFEVTGTWDAVTSTTILSAPQDEPIDPDAPDAARRRCAIRRVELALAGWTAPARFALEARSIHLGAQRQILTEGNPTALGSRLRPEQLPALARFEGLPLGGPWVFTASDLDCSADSLVCRQPTPAGATVTLLINPEVQDPLDPDHLAPDCADGPTSSSFEPCRWSRTPLTATLPAGATHTRLIEGSQLGDDRAVGSIFRGGFLTHEALTVCARDTAGRPIDVAILAVRADRPLATGQRLDNGSVCATLVIDDTWQGRYLMARITTPASAELAYSTWTSVSRQMP